MVQVLPMRRGAGMWMLSPGLELALEATPLLKAMVHRSFPNLFEHEFIHI